MGRQIDFWLPRDQSFVAHEDAPPRVGELVTWSGIGDFVVESVHYTMRDPDVHGRTGIGPITVTLADDLEGRQFTEWKRE